MTNHPIPIHHLLIPYIKKIEIIDAIQSIEPYKVYPDLYTVMGFQYEGGIGILTKENKKIALKRIGITGLLTESRSFQTHSPLTKTILIILYPWAIPGLFNESAAVLTDQSLGLADIITGQVVAILEEKIQSTTDPMQMVNFIQECLVQLYLTNNHNYLQQQRVIQIAQNLALKPSQLSVKEIASHYGYSKRSLERHFQSTIGLSPKRFMITARFQQVLQKIQAGECWERIAESLNYYDQSHFIKEFQQFTNTTPQKFSSR